MAGLLHCPSCGLAILRRAFTESREYRIDRVIKINDRLVIPYLFKGYLPLLSGFPLIYVTIIYSNQCCFETKTKKESRNDILDPFHQFLSVNTQDPQLFIDLSLKISDFLFVLL